MKILPHTHTQSHPEKGENAKSIFPSAMCRASRVEKFFVVFPPRNKSSFPAYIDFEPRVIPSLPPFVQFSALCIADPDFDENLLEHTWSRETPLDAKRGISREELLFPLTKNINYKFFFRAFGMECLSTTFRCVAWLSPSAPPFDPRCKTRTRQT